MSARRERKVVTVLFADLVGFTSRAESLDPEDVEAFLRPVHEHLRVELERYGATVEKFIGDAVMALFGAPQAHEDDPERAVRSALAIRDWSREQELELRIGITTGEALVSLGARPEAGEGMASGDVVNTASRLQTAAGASEILVDEATYQATRQRIAYADRPAVAAKGKGKPIHVWAASEATSRFGVDVEQAPRAPLVGRERELRLVLEALGRARETREPQLVTLVGVPGIGKSRLVYELFRAIEDDPEFVNWRQGRSLPYGEGVTYWALAEMVKAQAGILETDSTEQAATKLGETVSALLGDDGERPWVEAHLRPLVGLTTESELGGDRQAEAFAAWRRFVEALAEERPLVVVFEDLHWADDGLLDFVDHLVDWVRDVPLLVLCASRPELLSRRPGWGGGKPNAVTVSLPGLSEDETARLVHALLGRSVLPAGLQSTLVEQAGGNPLYAEEFARIVDERGVVADGDLPLPASLQGIIAARLDALPQQEKELAQEAAVVGKVFWAGALTAVGGGERHAVEERLHALERKQFVRRERRSSVAAETQYAFTHLLVRDVAYGQIPRARRAEKHRLAAEWIESLAADRSEDRAEMLAHHYLAALELAGAAGIDMDAVAGPARTALRDAGDRAMALNAFAAARRFYAAAIDLTAADDPERPYVLFAWARANGQITEHDFEVWHEVVEGLLAAGDSENAAEAEAFAALGLWVARRRDAAEQHIARAAELVEALPPSPAKARVLAIQSQLFMLADGFEAVVRVGRESLAMADELGLDDVRASVLNNVGTSRVARGDEGGLDDLRQSLAIAAERNSPEQIHRAYHNLMESYRRLGRLRESSEALAEERRSDERFGVSRLLRWVTAEEASDTFLRGDWVTALDSANRLLAEAEAGVAHYAESGCRTTRAAILLARGDGQGADDDSERAVELARTQRDPQVLSPALGLRALVLLSSGRRADASRLVDDAFAVPLYYGALHDLAWVTWDLGRGEELLERAEHLEQTPWREAAIAIASGRPAEAADVFERIGAVAYEASTRLRSGSDTDVRRALDFYRSVGAARYVREGEAMLAASA